MRRFQYGPGQRRHVRLGQERQHLQECRRQQRRPVDSAALSEVKRVFKTFTDILGILEDRWTGKKEDASSKDYDDLMQAILDIRQECRAQKQYALADAIRDKLAALGITIEDSPQGARWKK